MFCALCGADNPNNGRFCSKCGTVLQGQRGMPPPGSDYGTLAEPYTGPTKTSGKAIGSLICGIVFFFFPSAIAAIILGHLSLSDIRRSGGRLTGRGLATAGLVLGYMGLSAIPIMIVAAIAIPNLLRARIAANEAGAVGSLRRIDTAAFAYSANYSNGFPPGLEAMSGIKGAKASCDQAQLIDPILASGQKEGYTFSYVWTLPEGAQAQTPLPAAAANGCTARGGDSFQVNADPLTRGTTGQRSFFTDQTGVIRFNLEGPATADSPPVN
jgi:type IV pilus assembly protein PilA